MKKTFLLLGLVGLTFLSACGPNASSKDSSNEFSSSSSEASSSSSIATSLKDKYNCISINEAIEIAKTAGGTATMERYFIYGVIDAITNYTYGSMTIKDGDSSISAYNTWSSDGTKRYDALDEKPVVGDEVVLYSTLKTYNGTPEIDSGWIIEFATVEDDFNIDEYTSMTIKEARTKSKDTKVIVEGWVARVTYANGKLPNGFYLYDDESSIYVYDASLAASVKEGNKIKIAATKDYWILESEVGYASKFSYNGANQLVKVHLIENDKGTKSFGASWVQDITIKSLINTPFSEDITNLFFKTNSYIKKDVKPGYINYYLNDIDGVTGSYVYTQCNGADFTWLDEFDGKICTVYVTAINAKSTNAGCNWRLIPVHVSYDNYQFDLKNVCSYVFEYHVKELVKSYYTGDPVLELPKTISSELLGFNNATISYKSTDTNVLTLDESGEKVILHLVNDGSANLQVTIKYEGNEDYIQSISITLKKAETGEYVNVITAINEDLEKVVTVKGIAGPSLVNQTGFYLIDETGMIPIRIPADTLKTIGYGNKVVLRGTKTKVGKTDGTPYQVCLDNCELVANLYGSNDYSTASFIDAELTDLLNVTNDTLNCCQVYRVKGKLKKVAAQYYTNIYVTDGTNDLLLYCSNASQYSFLNPFLEEKELTFEIALCNWNSTKVKGAILSVTDQSNNKTVNKLNYN